MSSIDIEKFYNTINNEVCHNIANFPGIEEIEESYLENVECCTKIIEYQPEDIYEFEKLFDSFCDGVISEAIKKECAKIYLKEYMKLERTNTVQLENVKNNKGVIPAYIYTF